MSQKEENQILPDQKSKIKPSDEKQNLSTPTLIKYTDLDILKFISQDTTTCVCIVKHKQTNDIYALKKISYLDSVQQINLLVKEYYILRSLNHPNLISIHTSFYYKGYLCILSELINGYKLNDYLEVSPQFPENILAIFAHQCLQALQYLRSKRETHRNLKPSNIFFTDKSEVKIDHPIRIKKSFRMLQPMPGPFCYLAPEILSEKRPTFKSDVWSFGLIIFQCAFGRFPLTDTNLPTVSTVWKLIGDLQTDVDVKLPPEYSNELIDFVSGCLKLNPDERTQVDDLIKHEWITKNNNEDNKDAFIKWSGNLQAQISLMKKEKIHNLLNQS